MAGLTRFSPLRSDPDGPVIIVVGDVMLDRTVLGRVDRLSPEAPVPVVAVADVEEAPGGAANVAVNLASLGFSCHLFGAVGEDAAAARLRELLAAVPNLRADLESVPGRHPTTVKTRVVACDACGDGRVQLVRYDVERDLVGWRTSFNFEDAFMAAARAKNQAVVLVDYGKGLLGSDVLTTGLISRCARLGIPVVAEPKSDLAAYCGATVIKQNAVNAAGLVGSPPGVSYGDLTRKIADVAACKEVVVTYGSGGAVAYSADENRWLIRAALPVDLADVVGAGDSFLAALSGAVACRLGMSEALDLATAAGAAAVSRFGTTAVTQFDLWRASCRDVDKKYIGRLDCPNDVVDPVSFDWLRQVRHSVGGVDVVVANGCFDLLHAGHLSLLEFARRQGEFLIVAIDSDRLVAARKGPGRPAQTEAVRARQLCRLPFVDLVVSFDSQSTLLAMIRELAPGVLVKGADYRGKEVVGSELLTRLGGSVVLAPADVTVDVSTTSLLNRGVSP